MKNATIRMDEAGLRPQEIEIDSRRYPIDAFLLLTNVPCDPPAGHMLAFGSSHKIGELVYNLWNNCVSSDPAAAIVLESVAKDILDKSSAFRQHRLELSGRETVQ